jgi:CIC family chloride channel protein
VERYLYGNLMESITVLQAMITDVMTVNQTDTVRKVGLKIKETNHRGFPVMTEDGFLAGMVTRTDINKAHAERNSEAEIRTVMTRDLIVCYPNESLKTAMHKIASRNIDRIPVVERDNESRLIGILTRKSLINAYNRALEFKKTYSDIRPS